MRRRSVVIAKAGLLNPLAAQKISSAAQMSLVVMLQT